MRGARLSILVAMVGCACESSPEPMVDEFGAGDHSGDHSGASTDPDLGGASSTASSGASTSATSSNDTSPNGTGSNTSPPNAASPDGTADDGSQVAPEADGAGGNAGVEASDSEGAGDTGGEADEASQPSEPTTALSSDVDSPGGDEDFDGGVGSSRESETETGNAEPSPADASTPAVSTPSIVVFPVSERSKPANCSPEVVGSGDDYCLENLACDGNEFVDISCAPTEGGNWECNCTTHHYLQTFEVSDANGAIACASAAELCSAGERPVTAEPEACSAELQYSGPTYCELLQQCTQPVQLADGVIAAFTDETTVNCTNDGGNVDAFHCTCDVFGDGFDRSFRLSNVGGEISGEEACNRVLELCNSEPTTFGGAQTCGIASANTLEDRCDIRRSCLLSSSTDEALAADALEQTACQSSGDGTAQCQCDTTYYSFAFSFADPGSEVRCADAGEICASAYEIQLEEEPSTCDTTGVELRSVEHCGAVVTCGQAGRVGGDALVVYNDIDVECAATNAGWQCSCATPLQSVELEVEASLELLDACRSAAETCPSQLEDPVGLTVWRPAGSIR